MTDPSDDPSTTENFDNLPAIIGDMSIGAQLGDPLQNNGCSDPDCALSVNLKLGAAPFGLIQEFESLIRFGALTFNFFGSLTECPANVLCSNVCSTSSDVSCMVNADCPTGETCVPAANTDGGHIINLEDASGNRGKEGDTLGKCSSTTTTTCTNNAHCPDGEKCVFSVGDHTTGLIYALDSVRAMTWTPFAEDFYNAIGYFAQRVDTRLNGVDMYTSDFIVQTEDADYKAPVQYRKISHKKTLEKSPFTSIHSLFILQFSLIL